MRRGRLEFTNLNYDSQELGSTEEQIVSRIFFDLYVRGDIHMGLFSDVRQVAGTNIDHASLEISLPPLLKDVINRQEFQDRVQENYREAVRSNGLGSQVSLDPPIRMHHKVVNYHKQVDIEILSDGKPEH